MTSSWQETSDSGALIKNCRDGYLWDKFTHICLNYIFNYTGDAETRTVFTVPFIAWNALSKRSRGFELLRLKLVFFFYQQTV